MKKTDIGIAGGVLHVYQGMHPVKKYTVTQGHEL